MIGYKILSKNMKSLYGNIRYIKNRAYEFKGSISLYSRGYHFCDNPVDVFRFRSIYDDNRIFQIDTMDGKVEEDEWEEIYVTNKIKLIKELSYDDIELYIKDHLMYLLNKRHPLTLATIVHFGYGFKELENTDESIVKRELIKHHHNLERYIDDKDPYVRCKVAFEKYGLDRLEKDPELMVRNAVQQIRYEEELERYSNM